MKQHSGQTCEDARRLDGFEWEKIGDGADGKAHRCPKCKSPFEKMAGCVHMTCSICKYEWCWVCGLAFHSAVHYGQFGGMVCEIIAWITFKGRSSGVQALLYILIFLGLPFIVLFLSTMLGMMATFVGIHGACCSGCIGKL